MLIKIRAKQVPTCEFQGRTIIIGIIQGAALWGALLWLCLWAGRGTP